MRALIWRGKEFLVSGEILRAIPELPSDIHAEPLGGVSLRSKEDDVELLALTRLAGRTSVTSRQSLSTWRSQPESVE